MEDLIRNHFQETGTLACGGPSPRITISGSVLAWRRDELLFRQRSSQSTASECAIDTRELSDSTLTSFVHLSYLREAFRRDIGHLERNRGRRLTTWLSWEARASSSQRIPLCRSHLNPQSQSTNISHTLKSNNRSAHREAHRHTLSVVCSHTLKPNAAVDSIATPFNNSSKKTNFRVMIIVN